MSLPFVAFLGPVGSYSIDNVNKFVKLAVLDCRGLEPVDFDPRVRRFLYEDKDERKSPDWRCLPSDTLVWLDRTRSGEWHQIRRH
jgi:hypothetical protein